MVLGSSQVATSFTGMVRSKILAVLLGPEGVGLFAQLQNVQLFSSSVVPLGMQLGAVRYIAKYRATKPESVPRYVANASRTFLGLSILCALGCIVLLKPIAGWALGDSQLFLYLLPAVLGIPFMIQTQMWLGYLEATLEIKAYSRTNVMTASIGLLMAVPLVLIWKRTGAAVYLCLLAIAGYIIARLHASAKMTPEVRTEIKAAPFDKKVLKDLITFSAGNLPVFVISLGMPFLIRTQIINDLGLAASGIYQAAYAISIQILNVPFMAVATYSTPRICGLLGTDKLNPEVNNAVRLVVLLKTVAILLILLNREFVVQFLFSSKFLPALALIPLQLVGEHFKGVAMSIQIPLLQQKRFRARTVQHVLQYALFLTIFYLTPPRERLMGAVLAYAISWAFAAVMFYVYTVWLNRFKFDGPNWRLVITSTIAVVAIAVMPHASPAWKLAGYGITLVWIMVAVSPADWARVFRVVRDKLPNR